MILKKIFTIITLTISLAVYSQEETSKNVIIYLDLSDRLEREDQINNDKQLIKHCVNLFKTVVESSYVSGKLWSSDAISINFKPPMRDTELASNLTIDFETINDKDKVDAYKIFFPQEEDPTIFKYIDKVYELAYAQHPKYPGSDFYEFLREDLPYLVKDKDPDGYDYENILIVITDGYVYMSKQNPKRENNKLGHLEGPRLDALRNNSKWEELYETNNWGMISTGKKFNNLKVLGLQFYPDCIVNSIQPRTNLRPLKPCINEFDVLKKFWTDWFEEMGVQDIRFLKRKDNINPSIGAINNILNK